MIEKKGISLIVTVITIIIMIIIAGAVILTFTGTNILDEAETATKTYNKQQYKQIIGNEFAILRTSEEAKGKTTRELFEMLEEQMNIKELTWIPLSSKAYIEVNNEYMLALYEDGSIKEEEIKVLDVSNGSIDLKAKGYVQGEAVVKGTGYATSYTISGEMVEYTGAYIITGTSTENFVRVLEAGTYDIIINDLNIDVSDKGNTCAFNANRNKKASGVNVNLYIEGDNVLRSGASSAGLGFAGALPNLNGETSGSVLTMQGNGNLYVEGGHYSAAIGSGYTGPDSAQGEANNIIINGGNITAKSGGSATACIGGALRKAANNIVINGGNIVAVPLQDNIGIGAAGAVKGLVINGGNIIIEGNNQAQIGGSDNSEDITIKGGHIKLKSSWKYPLLGKACQRIIIEGGTISIIATSSQSVAIGTKDVTENINITGGNLHLEVAGEKFAIEPTDGKDNVYLTEIQLQNITEETLVTAFTTSDNLTYGIKDMYTNEEGKIFVYLPIGERTINITAGGKEYTGTVVTGNTESTECTVLNEK